MPADQAPPAGSGGRPVMVMTGISLLLPITLSTMAIVLLAPILPQIMQSFSAVPGYDYWVPMILTIPALCVALFSPVAGMMGDYFGRRRLLLASFVVYGVVGIAPVFLHDLTAIMISASASPTPMRLIRIAVRSCRNTGAIPTTP